MRQMRKVAAWVAGLGAALVPLTSEGLGIEAAQRVSETKNSTAPPSRLFARATERIDRNLAQIRVYQGRSPVRMPPYLELLVATPLDRDAGLADLVGKSLALVRSEKHEGQWDVYVNVWSAAGNDLTLAENILVVRKALVSSPEHPIQFWAHGRVHDLKAGEVLLIVG